MKRTLRTLFFVVNALVLNAHAAQQTTITGVEFIEIEESFQKNLAETLALFFNNTKEQYTEHEQSSAEQKRESALIRKYNKAINTLAQKIEKKVQKINHLFTQESDQHKEEFLQEEGAENIIAVRYIKSTIIKTHELRSNLIMRLLDKLKEKMLRLHKQLEQQLNSYYLHYTQDDIEQTSDEMLREAKEYCKDYSDAIAKSDSSLLINPHRSESFS